MTAPATAESLADLRVEIDRIDADMHALLIARGAIIDRISAAKARAGGGSAFRPDREAAMMRAIAERHRGELPLDTVEGIWRIIISTFTYLQAAYTVHADASGGDAAMRDSARFHFGFTVPLAPHAGAAEVIAAVARSGGSSASGDLGLLRLDAGAAAGPWWRPLMGAGAPKIIARLPFVERPDHPAGMPVLVIANPSAAAPARDEILYGLSVERWRPGVPDAIRDLGGSVLADAADGFGLALLAALPGTVDADALRGALVADAADAADAALAADVRIHMVGSHAARYGFRPAAPDA